MAGIALLFHIIALVAQSDAKVFTGGDHQTSQVDVEAIPRGTVEHFKDALSPMFATLSKNDGGRLEPETVRYVLHRFFKQRREWFIRGLEPTDESWHISSDPQILAQFGWVPALIKTRTGPSGMDLDELAAVAAVIEDRIHKESVKTLEDIYEVYGFRKDEALTEEQVDQVLSTFLMVFLKQNVTLSDPKQAVQRLERYKGSYKSWGMVSQWLDTEVKDPYFKLHPASDHKVNFADTARIAEEVVDTFGAFQDRECLQLKRALIEMGRPSRKAARIRLPEFYGKTRHTLWRFTEKVDYLRTLGALDESNATQPLVIMPNYILSYPNCLKETSPTNLYSICCHHECEDLMAVFDREVAAPVASPEQIIDIVTVQSSDTVVAPRELPEGLTSRLQEIARAHGGKVHLHSRLFAQWMHHAYPFECPYPHETAIKPQTADEWTKAVGQETAQASHEEMQKVVDDACPISEHEHELPWSHADAVVGAPASPPPIGFFYVLVFLSLGVISMLALWAVGSFKHCWRMNGIFGGVLLVCLGSVCALSVGLIDGTAFACELAMVCAALVARRIVGDQQGKGNLQKVFV